MFDSKTIIKTCPKCSQKSRDYYKREPTNRMIFTKPMERILWDLTELPDEIESDSNIKYQFNLIDHFSKNSFSYLLNNQKSTTILNCIKECSNKSGFPEVLGIDNST